MLHRGPGFFRSDRGQDLAEYCLLTALVVLVAAAIFLYVSGGIHNLWGVANTSLGSADTAQHTGASSGSQPAQR